MTGAEMKKYLDACDNQCSKCRLYRPNAKKNHTCVKVFCEAWKPWAEEQRKNFAIKLDSMANGKYEDEL